MAREFLLPDIGEGLTEAEIVRWLVEVGDDVVSDQPLVEVETDKAVVEIPAPQSGVLLFRGGAVGDVIEVGQILAVIGERGESWSTKPIVGTLSEEPELVTAAERREQASAAALQALPAVRKLARDLGVDLASIEGTGPGGRITRKDVEAAASPDGRQEERKPLSKLRRTIAENLTRSWHEIPHVTTFEDVDGRKLLEARRELADGELPLEAFVILAVLPALKQLGEFNATLAGDDLILKLHYDIGVAVDTEDGLIVPVVKGVDQLTLEELAGEVVRLSRAAQDRSLTPAELQGATFTVSNIGAIGGGHGTPIVPYGTTAILSIGRAQDRPVVRDSQVVVAPMIPLSLSYDHRVIDGAVGRRFMALVVESLEEPSRFLP